MNRSTMISIAKIKSIDFFRKTPRDLTEASLSGAGISIVAAISMIFLFGMELQNFLAISTSTAIIIDKSSIEDSLRIDFNLSFPVLSCEFASVDVSDVVGTNRLNITKTVRKYSINQHFETAGFEVDYEPFTHTVKHDEKVDEGYGEGSLTLSERNFDRIIHEHPIVVVNFYAPWCHWSNRLKPAWEKTAKVMRQRLFNSPSSRTSQNKVQFAERCFVLFISYSLTVVLLDIIQSTMAELLLEVLTAPEKLNCVKGITYKVIHLSESTVRARIENHGMHIHETYYGDRDTDSLVLKLDALASSIAFDAKRSSGVQVDILRRPAPPHEGCRIEGFVWVKKVPGNLVISASSGSHSFDASLINMSHVISTFSFGSQITPIMMSDMKRLVPHLGGSHNRLDGQDYMTKPEVHANVTIEHYLQVVKTEVLGLSNELIEDYEYTAHTSWIQAQSIPAAKFHLEFSPLQVLITENPKSFSHFITNLCAIIGGVFTVAGILDSVLYNTYKLAKKVELGKNF
ncbi:hypothetical protein OSB04_015351 [Centaurea solstitialis]|uniref:Thioredoxin domain-containing protein n=1 Tax=Centaurea solstitialis TaxID=347529 RepID=A0AA38TA07_9ASTR|nr:hypothetical protein OSB04_015351 [Centaurea solstitialis]